MNEQAVFMLQINPQNAPGAVYIEKAISSISVTLNMILNSFALFEICPQVYSKKVGFFLKNGEVRNL